MVKKPKGRLLNQIPSSKVMKQLVVQKPVAQEASVKVDLVMEKALMVKLVLKNRTILIAPQIWVILMGMQ